MMHEDIVHYVHTDDAYLKTVTVLNALLYI
jgi:hypothetical protein